MCAADRERYHLLQFRNPLTAADQEENQNAKALDMIQKISPAAWRHIHMNGHYTFRGNGQPIDLDTIVAGLDLV